MTTLLVTPKTNTQRKLVEKFMRDLGLAVRLVTDEQKEDMGLSLLMKKADRTKKVSRKAIMKKLA